MGVALRVRLPHHLRFHDLGFPGHGCSSGARRAPSVPREPSQPEQHRSHRAPALTAAPPPCARFKGSLIASLRNLPPQRKVRCGSPRPPRGRWGHGGQPGPRGPGDGWGWAAGTARAERGQPAPVSVGRMNGEAAAADTRSLSSLKVARRRVGSGRNHRFTLFTGSPQNYCRSVCLFFFPKEARSTNKCL